MGERNPLNTVQVGWMGRGVSVVFHVNVGSLSALDGAELPASHTSRLDLGDKSPGCPWNAGAWVTERVWALRPIILPSPPVLLPLVFGRPDLQPDHKTEEE